MQLNRATTECLSRQGRYVEILADSGRDPAAINQLPLEHRLILADALAKTGQYESGRAVCDAVLQGGAASNIRAKCEAVLGAIARDTGQTPEAIQRFERSIRLSEDNGDIGQAALSSVLAFRVISERSRLDSIGSHLAAARKYATKAGDPHITALLHEYVARQEAQAGNFDEARRHLRIAMAIVDVHPNSWLEQMCAVNAFCIALYECDFLNAEKHLGRASALTAVTGALESVVRNNEGHLCLHVGKFGRAEAALMEVRHRTRGEVFQSALDGLARLYFATERFRECAEALNELRDLQGDPSLVTSFPYRSSLVTRARLLMREQKWHEAAEICRRAIHEGEKVDDRRLVAASCFLLSHASLKGGDNLKGATHLIDAAASGIWNIREYQGSFAQIHAHGLSEEHPPVAAHLAERARRVWVAHHNRCAAAEFARSTRTSQRISTGASQDSVIAETAAVTLSAVASAFDFSYSPDLLGAELRRLLETARIDARIVETGRANGDDLHRAIELGAHGGRTLRLTALIPADHLQATVVADVFRIANAALTLESLKEKERNRAAIWPADAVDEEEGALFVADEMRALLTTARRIAKTNVPVLITGETGTGKEILARTIHAYSGRTRAAFLPFNCSSTPRDMLDSQLFGHRRGAFTGALESAPGVIRAAAEGTLFLDEIGEMPLDVQPKLLRFLESGEVHPIGEPRPLRVDVRVIAATNAPLDRLVREGRFREDLLYRLNIVPLHLPPLRERRVEIPALATHYLTKHAREFAKGDLRLAEETMEYLLLYRWPGNVRQLANEMRRMAALAETGAVLMPEHLSPEIAASRRTIPPSARVLDPNEVVVRLDQPMAAGIEHLERAMLQYALRKCAGRMEDTAAMLGLSRKGLYLKRQRFGIDPPETAASEVA